jgi:fused signal recognition particle receptor
MFGSLAEKLRSFLGKTAEAAAGKPPEPKLSTATKVKAVLSDTVTLSPEDLEGILWELQIGLLENDVAVNTAEDILEKLRRELSGARIPKDDVGGFVRKSMRDILLTEVTPKKDVDLFSEVKAAEKPYKILFLGVNGTGKTTTMAKFAHMLKRSGFSVVFAAGDTFRAGAIEQLQKHGEALGVKVISHQKGGDSAAVFYDAVEYAKARKIDVVLADSAGRMQTNANLMDELKKVVRVNKPDLKIFVGDALAGNDAVEQAREFNEAVGVDAVILSKLDADAKGGAALSITHEIGEPIIYVGMGQRYEDLAPFDREWFVEQLL